MLDALIIGQGIAGSMIAHHFEQEGLSFHIIDQLSGMSSSRIAAGIINPITGRRFVKSWKIDELYPYARKIYQQLEKESGQSIVNELYLQKLFQSTEQVNDWHVRQQNNQLSPFSENREVIKLDDSLILNPYGSFTIKPVLKVNIGSLLDYCRNKWKKKNVLTSELFNISALQVHSEGIAYNDIQAKRIVFCEGVFGRKNPWFSYLPLRANKGEALIIRTNVLPDDCIIGGKANIIPLEKNLYYVGATYDWSSDSFEPTTRKREKLIDHLKKTIQCSFTVEKHLVGVRPTVVDRRPFIGSHPTHKNVFICNGMGTKGLSLAPFFAQKMADHLVHNSPLLPEVDVLRYRRYWQDQ